MAMNNSFTVNQKVVRQTHEMKTVGLYCPLAGTGKNTIRLLKTRYENMRPGDLVTMTFYARGAEDNELDRQLAQEHLVVKAVAVASRRDILEGHAKRNHMYSEFATWLRFCNYITEKLYPDSTDECEFMAIYFE